MSWLKRMFNSDKSEKKLSVDIESNCLPSHQLGCSCMACSGIGQAHVGISSQLASIQQGLSAGHITISSGSTLQQLSPEELKELAELERQRAIETRRLKLEHFKKLPPSLRQRVVDVFMWSKARREMDGLEAPKTPREIELEQKNWQKMFSQFTGMGSAGIHGYPFSAVKTEDDWTPFRLPAGLTEDDLVQAHNDACMEETLRGDNE